MREVGSDQGRAGAVEGPGGRVPGFFEYGEGFAPSLAPGRHRAGQVGGSVIGGACEIAVEGAGGGGQARAGVGGGKADRVLPFRQLRGGVRAGGEKGVGAGGRLGGEEIQGKGVGPAGRVG